MLGYDYYVRDELEAMLDKERDNVKYLEKKIVTDLLDKMDKVFGKVEVICSKKTF